MQGDGGGLNVYVHGRLNGQLLKLLCDTGASCSCLSLKYFNKYLRHNTKLLPNDEKQPYVSANNTFLDIVGTANISLLLGNKITFTKFLVIKDLSQDAILGTEFLSSASAVIDFNCETISLFRGTVVLPLVTNIDNTRVIRTLKRIRIRAHCEALIPVKLPNNKHMLGITETLPKLRQRGLGVAAALVDCNHKNTMLRIINVTNSPLFLKAGRAVAYLSLLPLSSAGITLTNMTPFFDSVETDVNVNNVNNSQPGPRVCSVTGFDTSLTTGSCSIAEGDSSSQPGTHDNLNGERSNAEIPNHAERMRILTEMGVRIGQDTLNKEQAERLSLLLYNYRDVMATDLTDIPEMKTEPHRIPLFDDRPYVQQRYRYDANKEQKLEELCDKMKTSGIIEESESIWNSPVLLLTKKDGSVRFVVDYRGLNARTKPLFCALPKFEDTLDQIASEKPRVYSLLDLRQGYFSVPLQEESKQYTAFSSKSRHFHFCRLPQGYLNSGSAFTYSLSRIFAKELKHHLCLYVDDALIFHRDVNAHLDFLAVLFQKFRDFHIRVHPCKLHLTTSSTSYLGFSLSEKGYSIDLNRCKIVKNYPRPKNIKEVKRYLGVTQYYRKTIRNYSHRSAALRELLRKNTPFFWGAEQEASFTDLRDAISSGNTMSYPDRDLPFRVTLDASKHALGYVLSNLDSQGNELPVFFGGRATNANEQKFSACDLELSSLLAAVKAYEPYISGSEFQVKTDHLSLTYLNNLRFGTSRLVRAAVLLSQFKFKVIHTPGRTNVVADAISRIQDLEPDPLTTYQQNRHCAANQIDLSLQDNADTDFSATQSVNIGIQCDLIDFHGCSNVELGESKSKQTAPPAISQQADRSFTAHPCCRVASNLTACSDIHRQTATSGERDKHTARTDGKDQINAVSFCPVSKTSQENENNHNNHTINALHTQTSMLTDATHISPTVANATDENQTQTAATSDDDETTDGDRTAMTSPDDDGLVTLQTQALDEDLAPIILYLTAGNLPNNNQAARNIILKSENFFIRKNQLFHIQHRRQKNNAQNQPVSEALCVPKSMQPLILARYHSELTHLGAEKLWLTMRDRVYWKSLYSDIRTYVAQCAVCTAGKCNTHPLKPALQSRQVPDDIFDTLHIDHIKVPVRSRDQKYAYILVLLDGLSLNCELVATKTTNAKETCDAIVNCWISRYGTFKYLISDRHASFTSKLTQMLLQAAGVKHIKVASYHSRGNASCERMNSLVLQGLRTYGRNNSNWHEALPVIAGAYRASVNPSRGFSPFELMYGKRARLPVETLLSSSLPAHERMSTNMQDLANKLGLLRKTAQAKAQDSRDKATARINKSRNAKQLQLGQRVYIRREKVGSNEDHKTAPLYDGPFVIAETVAKNVYRLNHLYSGRPLRNPVHAERLRTCSEARAKRKPHRTITLIHSGLRNNSRYHIPYKAEFLH